MTELGMRFDNKCGESRGIFSDIDFSDLEGRWHGAAGERFQSAKAKANNLFADVDLSDVWCMHQSAHQKK